MLPVRAVANVDVSRARARAVLVVRRVYARAAAGFARRAHREDLAIRRDRNACPKLVIGAGIRGLQVSHCSHEVATDDSSLEAMQWSHQRLDTECDAHEVKA